MADLLREHEIGLLVAPDAVDFASGIEQLLNDSARAEKMGSTAREIALHQYSQDAIAVKLEDFYETIIAAKGRENLELAC